MRGPVGFDSKTIEKWVKIKKGSLDLRGLVLGGSLPRSAWYGCATQMDRYFSAQVQGWVSISAIWFKDGSQFLPSGIKIGTVKTRE